MNPLPPALAAHPDLDTWVRVDAERTVTVFTGKVELGQGIVSALARVAAEELDVAFERIRVETADTDHGLDERMTAGSRSMSDSGTALRQAAAEVRARLLELASARLEVPVERLEIRDGTISDPSGGGCISYWQIAGGEPLRRTATGLVSPKPAAAHRLVGRSEANRSDLPGARHRSDAVRSGPPSRADGARPCRASTEPGSAA